MAADTFTALLGLLLQGTGNNNNAWGTDLNISVIQLIENAIAESTAIATTGGTTTLTAIQARASNIVLTGTLTSDVVIVVPDTNKIYHVVNNTVGGGFFTRLKCSTLATAVNIPAGGKTTKVIAAGGVPYRQDAPEVGRYVMDAASLTGDVLECDGAAYKRASLPNLFAKIGTTYGNNDSTDFKVPDGYTAGKFLRSRTATVTVGTAQSNQNKSHTHTGSGTTSGVSATHTHTGSGTSSGQSATHTHSGTTAGASISMSHSHTVSGTTSAMSANASHTHTANGRLQGTSTFNLSNAAAFGGNNTASQDTQIITVDSTNTDHTHTFSATSSTVDLSHTHTITTGNASVDHTHTYSFTTAVNSVDHTHTYSFTTSTGSADGTEARPEALVGILCIRY